jgi:hypothetical protein
MFRRPAEGGESAMSEVAPSGVDEHHKRSRARAEELTVAGLQGLRYKDCYFER